MYFCLCKSTSQLAMHMHTIASYIVHTSIDKIQYIGINMHYLYTYLYIHGIVAKYYTNINSKLHS